jgi:hypothetical protein
MSSEPSNGKPQKAMTNQTTNGQTAEGEGRKRVPTLSAVCLSFRRCSLSFAV